jgi:hypothetical protein
MVAAGRPYLPNGDRAVLPAAQRFDGGVDLHPLQANQGV